MAEGLSILGNILNAGFGFADKIFNWVQGSERNQIASRQNDINQQTLEWNKQNAESVLNWNKEQYYNTLDYNKWLNQTQMEREDNAIQRRMADLKAAGLSPLLAAGDAASSSAGSSLTAPELQPAELNGVNFQAHQPYQLGLQDLWQSAVQNMQEFKQMAKTDAEKDLIASQTDSQNLENKRTVDLMVFESQKRIQDLNKGNNEIELQKASIDEAKRKAIKDNNKAEIDRLTIEEKNLENAKKAIEIQIQEEIKTQEHLRTLQSEHDTNVYLASPFTSAVVDQGMKTTVGQAAQDASLGVATGRSNERNSNLYDNYTGNNNSTPNQEIESLPNVGELQKGSGYQDQGTYYSNKKGKTYYKAGKGVAYGNDGSIYYGGRKIKPSENYPFDYIMNQIENTGMIPVECLYSD